MKGYIIALDAMGGDNAPDVIVSGGIMALRKYPDISLLLAGPEARLQQLLQGADDVRDRIEILPAEDTISMDEPPMLAVRRKVESSLVKAMMAVREGRAQAFVSAGSTGAVLAGGMLRIGRIPGVERPALAPILPGAKKPFLLIDCGANVDCQPKYLTQFGLMGSVYMKSVMGVSDPAVGLVNIGVEEEKGNKLTKETYQLMKQQKSYRFAGNCEAREIPSGDFDVVVTDGFAGNVILKYTEGIVGTVTGMLKKRMMETTRAKLGALLAKPAFHAFKKDMDYNAVGGAPMLGVQAAVVKAHGSSGDVAIMNAIRQAREMLEGDVVGKISEGLSGLVEDNNNA